MSPALVSRSARRAEAEAGRAKVSAARYESLDIWRGLACLLVLVNHSVWLVPDSSPSPLESVNRLIAALAARAWIGVPVFFVISGYCISASAFSHAQSRRPIGHYFLRRFRRIFPPYWIVLLGYALVVGVSDVLARGRLTAHSDLLRPWWFSGWEWLGSMTLTEIWRWHLIGGPKALVLSHAWTLCYEEQFYAVTGALLLLGRDWFFRGVSLLTLAVGAVALVGSQRGWPLDGYFFDGAWLEFALGILLFYAVVKASRFARVLAGAIMLGVLIRAASAGTGALLNAQQAPPLTFLVASGFALTALMLHRFDGTISRAPLLAGINTCGLMCYSLYLLHLPVIRLIEAGLEASGVHTTALSPLITIPLCAVPCLWLSWQFHLVVERRFMNLSKPQQGSV